NRSHTFFALLLASPGYPTPDVRRSGEGDAKTMLASGSTAGRPRTGDHVRKPPDRGGMDHHCPLPARRHDMATLRKEIPVASGATQAWHALRDFGQVHTKVEIGRASC